jgi:2-hydroxy-3-oxopropionate reductase
VPSQAGYTPKKVRTAVRTIAFIGLGIMGSPMAVNIAHAGHEVVGYNRSPARAADLVDAGGTAADSIAVLVSAFQ